MRKYSVHLCVVYACEIALCLEPHFQILQNKVVCYLSHPFNGLYDFIFCNAQKYLSRTYTHCKQSAYSGFKCHIFPECAIALVLTFQIDLPYHHTEFNNLKRNTYYEFVKQIRV
jgi:hypothetical protein